jgi:hypothetical protein
MKITSRFAIAAACLSILPASAADGVDCLELAVSVKHAVAAVPSKVLEIVEKEVAANPDCACEVVKAAIQGSDADSKLVASIVETAATAAPEKMRLVSQCAVAVAPEALGDVQAVMSRLDPNLGEASESSKSAKSPKGAEDVVVQPAWNPLDFPGQGPVGPTPGGSGGLSVLPPGLPPGTVPPIIAPPSGTGIDRPFIRGIKQSAR